ncbi:hypothetical protein K493DRAFT_209622 [Basidiobolus meristosporus CBS 931.73]|uniref:snRNA-activating protein complex subunit 3 n=1 Tax=Basidiobolus meristosporus CBS 931.73 TaxID=1314790 RepID=A0A1Y1YUQ5_9FUNG|nr:hypothetical protein K493DRAFT_209622 [Basidiobolus meristosporus CBS 931.73]|eukprot:ORY01467.1 hypothetical protein K493DRAFT_209622 [Basidiobolus meristosporus CBS 931.73]
MAVDLITDTEVVLSVAFYHKNKATTRMQEFLVLSSQPLTVLRDAFYCLSDFLTVENDEEVVNTQSKKVSSSYFLIENTFYNDMRSASAVDYSKVILDWVEENERYQQPGQAKYKKRVMGEVKFSDLSIRINQPYLFTHQGDCQHIFKFRDIRLLTKSDDRNRNAYPKPIFQCKITRHKCRMCYMYPAEYVTINDFHSGETPCYFCEHCYEPFHYDSQGRLLYEYQVFPYAHD